MMNEHELNRAIDAAAEQMMAREPSRALGYAVMARVREDVAPATRRLGWMMAAVTLVLCAALAIALINRPHAVTIPSIPFAARLPIGAPPAVLQAPRAVARHTVPTRLATPAAVATRVATSLPLPPTDVSPIELIETEPIALSAIEVPRLEREVTLIETISIEALTIEPLAASND